jgi:bifunctional DNA-binding transcriptional regulator/antitoxin component of YhaV-PrlF toxin-antitoxin module
MEVTLTVDQNKRLIVPEEAIEALHLEPGTSITVEVHGVTDAPPRKFDEEKFDAAIKKYRGSMREQFLADGYSSVDEYMDDIRPKW